VNLLEGPDYVATWALIIILTAVLGFLMWMINKFAPPLEPREPMQPIAEVKGEGAVE
jgi:H+/Cl- antiporter ClcA